MAYTPIYQITATGYDKSIYASDGSSWATARNATTGTTRDGLYVQSTLAGATRFIERTFLTFDTSNIPDNATIISATLSVYGIADAAAKDNSPLYKVYNSSHTDTIVDGDYDTMGTTEQSDTSFATLTVDAFNDYPLNAAGLSSINKTGTTKFCIRDSVYDLGNVQPGGSNVIHINDYTTSTTNACKLTINYTAPMTLGEYLGAGSTNTKLLLHLNGSSADSSGNGNNGTDTNITYVNGKFGKCASFNGSSSKIALPVTLSGSAFTYSIWVYCTNTDPATDSRVIDIRNSGYSNYITTSIDSNLFHAAVYDGTNYLAPTVAISANVWTHFAVTVYNGNFSIYKNGASVYSNAYTFNGITAGGAGYAMIGQEFNDGASRYYNGLIDEVIIESRAWSAAEIKRYYSMTKGYYATL